MYYITDKNATHELLIYPPLIFDSLRLVKHKVNIIDGDPPPDCYTDIYVEFVIFGVKLHKKITKDKVTQVPDKFRPF